MRPFVSLRFRRAKVDGVERPGTFGRTDVDVEHEVLSERAFRYPPKTHREHRRVRLEILVDVRSVAGLEPVGLVVAAQERPPHCFIAVQDDTRNSFVPAFRVALTT